MNPMSRPEDPFVERFMQIMETALEKHGHASVFFRGALMTALPDILKDYATGNMPRPPAEPNGEDYARARAAARVTEEGTMADLAVVLASHRVAALRDALDWLSADAALCRSLEEIQAAFSDRFLPKEEP